MKINVSFIPFLVLGFWSLLVTKLRKYYIIFVYILQGKMGKTEKNRNENHTTKVTKIPKTKRRKYGMQQPRMATDTLIVLFNRSLKHLSDHLPCLSACLHNTLRVNAPTESIKSITSPKIDQAITPSMYKIMYCRPQAILIQRKVRK